MVTIKSKANGKLSRCKEGIAKPFKEAFHFFTIKDGESRKPHIKRLGYLFSVITFIVLVFYLIMTTFKDTSSVQNTDSDIKMPHEDYQDKNVASKYSQLIGKEDKKSSNGSKRQRSRGHQRLEPIKYQAKQVIERDDVFNPTKTIPMGTNLIGRLLTSIDTRESEQFYKVFLPYGGKFQGGAEIPKGSTLFGKIRYPGKGKKVFMTFSKGVFPDGSEFQIQAQALSTKDYSPGLVGDFHGQSGARVAAALGLSLVSGASAALTEREQIGVLGQTQIRPTLKNALYGGLSQTAQTESQRQGQKLSERQEYVTLDAGKDLIINLTGAYIEK